MICPICPICNIELTTDSFGLFCPNESCCYISEMPNVVNEDGVIPLLYENEILIKWKIGQYGIKHWYLNGKLHRENGPAVEFPDGRKHWYLNGKLHREDGPAAENSNGDKFWYVNDKLHRTNGPAVEYVGGHKEWYLNGEFQKSELPNLQK